MPTSTTAVSCSQRRSRGPCGSFSMITQSPDMASGPGADRPPLGQPLDYFPNWRAGARRSKRARVAAGVDLGKNLAVRPPPTDDQSGGSSSTNRGGVLQRPLWVVDFGMRRPARRRHFGKRCVSPAMLTHGCALSAEDPITGFNPATCRRASLPECRNTRHGVGRGGNGCSASANCPCTAFPLSPGALNVFSAPYTTVGRLGIATTTLNAVPRFL